MSIVSREELIKTIQSAKAKVRFLGVLAIDMDWELIRKDWLSRINTGTFEVSILRESESLANNISIITSNRRLTGADRSYMFGNLKKILDAPSMVLRKYLVENNCKHLEPKIDSKEQQLFSLKTCYLSIPIPVVNIDDDYYFALSLTRFTRLDEFEKLEQSHPWHSQLESYFSAYFDSKDGAMEYSTEETCKGNRLEVINAYNAKREVMFPLPRDSFPDTKLAKLVVWALIFTRDGKVLIHKRGANAKDNRNMWDKSVGGHVAPTDVDTSKAIAREIVEELYKQEEEGQGGHDKSDYFSVNEDKMIFLGEWNPRNRNNMPFFDVDNMQDENYFFRLNYDFSRVDHDTVRHLIDGSTVTAHTFVDLYVCIASCSFSTAGLKNSDYRLLELHELYDAYVEKTISASAKEEEIVVEKGIDYAKEQFGIEVINDTDTGLPTVRFSVTPDLESLIKHTELFDQLIEFSDYVKANSQRTEKP